MGSKFFQAGPAQPSSTNLAARAFNAPSYAGVRAGARSQKDLAAAQAMYKSGFKSTMKDAAADAPGPRKV